MRRFGLIGFPLSHSFSRKYFEEKFQREKIIDCSYDLFEIETIQEFPELSQFDNGLEGLNITIPYKESIIPFLDELDDVARTIGAVNCIKFSGDKWKGFNTDAYGFEVSLGTMLNGAPEQAFVLGTGGSSKAVSYVLDKLKIPYLKVSRSAKHNSISYDQIGEKLGRTNLFVNTTPRGMFPKVNQAPEVPFHLLSNRDVLFDLIYNPSETLFLRRGKEIGCQIKNGLEMLELQAEKSWEIWNS